jgi:hypothetical protein
MPPVASKSALKDAVSAPATPATFHSPLLAVTLVVVDDSVFVDDRLADGVDVMVNVTVVVLVVESVVVVLEVEVVSVVVLENVVLVVDDSVNVAVVAVDMISMTPHQGTVHLVD